MPGPNCSMRSPGWCVFLTQSVIDTVSGADVCCEVLAGIARGWGWMAARGTLHPVPSTSAYPWVHEDGDRDPRQGLQARGRSHGSAGKGLEQGQPPHCVGKHRVSFPSAAPALRVDALIRKSRPVLHCTSLSVAQADEIHPSKLLHPHFLLICFSNMFCFGWVVVTLVVDLHSSLWDCIKDKNWCDVYRSHRCCM